MVNGVRLPTVRTELVMSGEKVRYAILTPALADERSFSKAIPPCLARTESDALEFWSYDAKKYPSA